MKRGMAQKLVIVIVIAAAVMTFKALDLGQYLTLSYMKASRQTLLSLYAENRATVIAGYMAVYIVSTAVSLPGAAVLTITAGALFGLLAGTVIASVSSTIGATLACSVSRFLLRDWVQGKFGDRIERINAGIEKEGAFYLFTLRLIPLFPFWLINLAMGLTKMRLTTFFWVSQAGMLAGTVVYVNAGRELGKIESMRGILSPGLIFSFVLIGLFPLAAKRSIAYYRSKKGKTAD